MTQADYAKHLEPLPLDRIGFDDEISECMAG